MRRAALILLLLTALWGPDLLLGQASPWTHDLRHHHVPWRAWAAGEWLAGRIPAWAPEVACGFPLTADGQTGSFYLPTLLLFALLPVGWALNLSLLLHHLWAGLGTFGWLRASGTSAPSSLLGAVTVAFSGFMATHALYLGMHNAFAWLPWLLWGIRRGSLGLTGLSAAMMLVAGHPQLAAFGLLLGAVVALGNAAVGGWETRDWRGELRTLGVLAVGVALGLLAAAPQLLATLELARFSARDGQLPEALAHVGSLPPQELVNAAFPYAFGYDRPGDVVQTYYHRGDGYWGAGVNHWEMAFFVGIPMVLLSLVGTRRAIGWAILAVVSMLLMLGGPGWELLRQLPGLGGFRFPVRFAAWFTLCVAMLGSTGMDRLRRAPPAVVVRLGWTGVGLMIAWVVGVLATGLAVDVGEDALREALRAFFQQQVGQGPPPLPAGELPAVVEAALPDPEGEDPAAIPAKVERILRSLQHNTSLVSASVLGPLALIGGMAALLFMGPRATRRWTLPTALVLMVYADLWVFGATYQARVPMEEVGAEPAALEVIHAEPGRTTVVDRRQHPDLDAELMSASLGLLHDVPDVILTSPLLMVRHEALLGLVGLDVGDRGPQKVERLAAHPELVDLLGVRWLLSTHDLTAAGMEPVAVPRLSGSPVGLWRNPDPLPRAFLVGCAIETSDPWPAMAELEPRRRALVELGQVSGDVDGAAEPGDAAAAEALPPCTEPEGLGEVGLREEGPERLVLSVSASRPAFLVQTDTWYPGWEARLDGQRVPLYRTDLVFRGVSVPAGEHELVLEYRPGWRAWAWPALGAWAVLLAAVGLRTARRWRRRSPRAQVAPGQPRAPGAPGAP